MRSVTKSWEETRLAFGEVAVSLLFSAGPQTVGFNCHVSCKGQISRTSSQTPSIATMTKLATLATLATILLAANGAAAFSTSSPGHRFQRTSRTSSSSSTTTSLYLFGSKPKGEGSQAQQPGMMDQLNMFKKAQELSQKKAAIDNELANEKIVGTAADGNVKVTIKYIPPQLPMNPTPGYEAAEVDIDESYLGSVSAEDLSASLVAAIRDGEAKAAEIVGKKYKSLEEDMMRIMGGGAPAPQ